METILQNIFLTIGVTIGLISFVTFYTILFIVFAGKLGRFLFSGRPKIK